jgi:hypothetical protein
VSRGPEARALPPATTPQDDHDEDHEHGDDHEKPDEDKTGVVIPQFLAAPAILAVAAAALVSCAQHDRNDDFLTLSAGEASLSPCTAAAPVSVEQLDTTRLPTCDPVGQVLVFPDGEQLQLPEQQGGGGASSSSSSDAWYPWQSVGNWGLVAARSSADCSEIDEWGEAPACLAAAITAFLGKQD